jgi:hypothetical protein
MIFDLLAFAGAVVVAVGVGLIYAPAGIIVFGLALAAAGVLGARVRATRGK